MKSWNNFNPRLREGGDPCVLVLLDSLLHISIHASAREATVPTFESVLSHDFNPRLREGGDLGSRSDIAPTTNFNPRLREGGDSFLPKMVLPCGDFNPRLREGGDRYLAEYGMS